MSRSPSSPADTAAKGAGQGAKVPRAVERDRPGTEKPQQGDQQDRRGVGGVDAAKVPTPPRPGGSPSPPGPSPHWMCQGEAPLQSDALVHQQLPEEPWGATGGPLWGAETSGLRGPLHGPGSDLDSGQRCMQLEGPPVRAQTRGAFSAQLGGGAEGGEATGRSKHSWDLGATLFSLQGN